MRLLFSTSDPSRAELVRARLQSANIVTELRQSEPDHAGIPGYPEVWVRDGIDFEYAALIFCNRKSHERRPEFDLQPVKEDTV